LAPKQTKFRAGEKLVFAFALVCVPGESMKFDALTAISVAQFWGGSKSSNTPAGQR
jgi:hypothetical protein